MGIYILANQLRLLIKGLLLLTLSQTLSANYLYNDGLYDLSSFSEIDQAKLQKDYFDKVETIGTELKKKTGISLYLLTTMKLEDNDSIANYGQEFIKDKPNSVVLAFSLLDVQVDIQANDESLYKYFVKEDVLAMSQMGGGSIIPLLPTRKKHMNNPKYTVPALLNGYGDIAGQIAASKEVTLTSWDGSTNRPVIRIIEGIIILTVLYGLFSFYKARKRRLAKGEL